MKGKKTIFEPYFARQNKQVLENTFQKTLELPLEFFEIQISKYQYFYFIFSSKALSISSIPPEKISSMLCQLFFIR